MLPLACRAQRTLTQALLSVKGPRQSSWQQTSRIPSDYRNIWTNLNLRPCNNHFFPSEMEREQTSCAEKCRRSAAQIKRPNIVVVLHLSLSDQFATKHVLSLLSIFVFFLMVDVCGAPAQHCGCMQKSL